MQSSTSEFEQRLSQVVMLLHTIMMIQLPQAEFGVIAEHNVPPYVQAPENILPTQTQTSLMVKGQLWQASQQLYRLAMCTLFLIVQVERRWLHSNNPATGFFRTPVCLLVNTQQASLFVMLKHNLGNPYNTTDNYKLIIFQHYHF